MIPTRVEIPEVNNGFVYLLVSLRDKCYRTCSAHETTDNLLTDLARHNSGLIPGKTRKVELRPWSLAAFAFGFTSDSERHLLYQKVMSLLLSRCRVDETIILFKQLIDTGDFGFLSFCKCGSLVNRLNTT